MSKLRVMVALAAIGLQAGVAHLASAQNYPVRPVRLLAAEAGGGADLVARFVSQGIYESLGQQVVVENHPARLIGELTARAAPDGYTLLQASSTFLFAPLFEETKYDAIKDFVPIVMIAKAPNVITVHPSLPVKTVKDLIALAKAKPGVLNYGTGGTGSSLHLAAELFKQMANVNIARVNYKGTGPAVNDLIGGQVQIVFATTQSVMGHVASHRLRWLAVTSPQPSALAPGLPTVAASGVPGYEMEAMYAIVAPVNTPEAVIKQINQVTVRFLNQPQLREKFLAAGIEPAPSTPEELGVKMKSEIAKVGKLVKANNMQSY